MTHESRAVADRPARDDPHPILMRGVRKRFGPVEALRGFDLRVQRGEVLGLLGRNGAGKSTALRILLGLVRPDAGEAVVHGEAPGRPTALARTGSLVEAPAYLPHLSGRDNVRALARARGLDDRAVDRALDTVDLGDRGGSRFGGYSLGMRQRLGVAGALLASPELLILDEPTNGLDPSGVASMRELICELGRGGTTVVLSSHVLSEVEQICSRVVVMDHGRAVAEGTVEDLRSRLVEDRVRLDVRPRPEGLRWLEEAADVEVVEPVEPVVDDPAVGPVEVSIQPERVPDLVDSLVRAGLRVHEVARTRHSLEDVFFQLTGSSSEAGVGDDAETVR